MTGSGTLVCRGRTSGPRISRFSRASNLGLERTVDFGWFGSAFSPARCFWLLKWTYSWVGNYGLAILFVTLFIRIALFPLTHKSYSSMKKMQKLAPKMNAIRDKYKKAKTDAAQRAKMNQELMALYQAEGYNPMSGCFPMLLQLPILIAFYNVLSRSIELRHAPFVLWIKDLSAVDSTYVLVILMIVTMYVQQAMTPVDPGSRCRRRSSWRCRHLGVLPERHALGTRPLLAFFQRADDLPADAHQEDGGKEDAKPDRRARRGSCQEGAGGVEEISDFGVRISDLKSGFGGEWKMRFEGKTEAEAVEAAARETGRTAQNSSTASCATKSPSGEAVSSRSKWRGRPPRRPQTQAAASVPPATPARERDPEVALDDEAVGAAEATLTELLSVAGLLVEIRRQPSEEELVFELIGDDVEPLLANKGEGLMGLEVLAGRIASKRLGRPVHPRLDAEGFRAHQKESLEELALRSAEEVKRTQRRQLLPPLPPGERRLIHLALAEDPEVTTESEGEGFLKRVAVRPRAS